MSFDVGAAGAYGILLFERGDVKALYDEFKSYVASRKPKETDPDGDDDDDDWNPDTLKRVPEFAARFRKEFKALGIEVPETATLIWTDTEDARPGRVITPADQFVLGFGLFTPPSDYPALDPSYVAQSKWHTWVWGG